MNADPNARDRMLNDLSSTLTPASEPISDPPPAPPVIPDHELFRRIGRGSYGEVWLARNVMGTWRAVKIVQRAAFDHDRPYEREFEGIRRFEPISRTHPSQLNVLHVGRNDAAGCFYYVMELADDSGDEREKGGKGEGEEEGVASALGSDLTSAPFPLCSPATYSPRTLRSDLYLRGRLPFEECLNIALALATALDHLHRHGLVHRDIKPSNIIFVNGIPKLADIGLVARTEATLSLVGTEGYFPPEGPGKPQADIFSLGKVLYEMATGRDRQAYPELPTNLIEQPAAERAQLAELNEIIVSACHTDLKQRYQTAAELHAELALLQSGKSVSRMRAVERRLRFVQRAGVLVTVVAVIAAGLYLWQSRQARQMQTLANEARHNELVARANLYAADINLAHQAVMADNLRQARVLLQNHVPKPSEPDLRGFEWRYLWQQCQGEELFSLAGHTNAARVLVFSPDGLRIAVGGYNGPTKILDLALRREVATLPGTNSIRTVSFSPQGGLLVTAADDAVRLWDARTFVELRQLPEAIAPGRFSPDGKYLVTRRRLPVAEPKPSVDQTDEVILWDTATWTATNSVAIPTSPSASVSTDMDVQTVFAPDGKHLAVLSDYRVRLFSLPDLQETLVLPEKLPTGFASRPFIALSPDNQTLAIPSPKGFGIRLWDINANRELRILPGHADHVFAAKFSPDGTVLATGSPDQTIKLWNVATGELLNTLKGQADEVIDVAYSPDGKLLASLGVNDAAIKLWDPSAKPRRDSLRKTLWPVGFDQDGGLLAFLSPERRPVVLDPATLQATGVAVPDLRDGVRYGFYLSTVSRDGHLQGVWAADEKVMEVWDRIVGKRLCSVPALIPLVSFASRRQLIATATTNQTTTVWQLPSGTPRWVFTNQFSLGLQNPTISPDEQHLLTGEGTQLRLWKLEGDTVRPLVPFRVEGDSASGAAFSPDGRLLATAEGGGIKLRAMPSAVIVGTLKGHTRTSIAPAFSPDSRTLASIADDRTVRLWHVATQRELLRFHTPNADQGPFQLEFSPDGRALAVSRFDDEGKITWLHFAPSLTEIAVAEAKH